MARSQYELSSNPEEQSAAANGSYSQKNGMNSDANAPPSYAEVTGNSLPKNKTAENGEDDKDGKKKEKEVLPTVSIFQTFRFADKLDWLMMFLGTVGAIGNGISLPALMIILGDMTDSFIDDAKTYANITVGDTPTDAELDLVDDMTTYAIYYTAIGCAVIVCGYIQVSFWLMASYRQTQRIRVLLLQAVLRQEVGWFDTHDVGELNTRISDDVNKIQEGIGDKLSNFLQWGTCCVAGLVIGFVYGWKLTLVILAVGPLLVLSGGLMAYLTTSFTGKELTAYSKAGAVAEEVLSSIRTVVAFGGQQKECQRYNQHLDSAKKFGIRKGAVTGVSMGLMFFIIFGSYALAFWYGGKLVREEPENYSAGRMMIVFFSVVFGTFALGNAAPNLTNFGVARGAAYTIWELIDRKSLIDSSSKEGKKPSNVVGNIEFKNVVFRYPSRPEVPVLNGLNLQINVGQTVALVGSSGCGKSTTVQLIQRFYDPLEGSVCIDGTDIRELNIQWLRQNIGVVSQEPVLFATTIAENIRYGRVGVSQAEIEAAAINANAHDFILKLPKKYETLVGERGAQLSGGQKQRVAIARALVRDPKILLLDEATSALDTESESTVQAALDKASEGRTTIIIAHRLSTVRNADVLVGFRDGVAAETGTHDQLMEQQGIYYQLVTNQTLGEEFDGIGSSDVGVERKLSRKISSVNDGRKLTRGMSTVSQLSDGKEEEEEKLGDPSIPRIMRMNAPEWLYILIGCLGALVNGASQPAFAVIFAEILGVFIETDMKKQEHDVMIYSILFLVIGLAQGFANFFMSFMLAVSGENLTMRVREMTFKAMLRQEIGFFDLAKNNTGALTTRLATDASAIQGTTGARIGTIVASIANIGTAFVIGFYYSWKLALVTIAFLPLVAIGGALQMKVMQGYAGGNQTALEGAGKVAIEAISNIRTVAALTKEEQTVKDYTKHTSVPHRSAMARSHLYGISFSFSQAVIFFAYAAIFYYGAHLVEDREITFEEMFKVFSAIVFGAMALGQAASFAPDYGKGKLAAARIFQLVDRVPEIDTYSEEGTKLGHVQGNIGFQAVKFCYPSRPTVTVLKDLSFEAKAGQMVALVGSSGCGKSTTVQLMERFYDPAQGQVMVDGQDLTGLNVQWLRSQMGLVQQEPILFDCSIRENIAYGDNSRDVGMDEIISAARNANIHSFIDSLPNGYETNVGDKGAQLSGGQKQRVAIARALVREPKILLLDEATSALDTESEKVVQEALDRAQEGRTSLVIAHRLSTIQNADCIIVFHHGQIAELGKHSELMAQKGIYYNLNSQQQRQT